MKSPESQFEEAFIEELRAVTCEVREDIGDRGALERNFRKQFQALNQVRLTDGEFQRFLDDIISVDACTEAHTLRNRSRFARDDGTPLNYTLVNIADCCKKTFEVFSQLPIKTDYSHHRYDVVLLINGVSCAQIKLKTLAITSRRAMEQIFDYKRRSAVIKFGAA